MRGGGRARQRKCSWQKEQRATSPEGRGGFKEPGGQGGWSTERGQQETKLGTEKVQKCVGMIPREQGSPWQDLRWGERAGMMELQMDRLTLTGASRTDGQEEGEE